jgi:hypothetical protein
MAFIYTNDGDYIALSEVLRADPQRGGGFRAFLRSGHDVVVSDYAWGEAMRGDIKGVLAAPEGYFVVERLTEDDGSSRTHKDPVLGWAITSGGAGLPITAGGISVDSLDVLVPDGRVVKGDGWFDDLAKWEAARNL